MNLTDEQLSKATDIRAAGFNPGFNWIYLVYFTRSNCLENKQTDKKTFNTKFGSSSRHFHQRRCWRHFHTVFNTENTIELP